MMIKLYFVTLPIFFAVDMIWLGWIARNFYRTHLGFLLRDSFDWKAALLFYAVFIFGLVYFVITPAFENRSWLEALGKGALFGLITYATYDLTNQATVKNWPTIVTIADLIWGTCLASSVSGLSYLVADRCFR